MDFEKHQVFCNSIEHLKDVSFFAVIDTYCMECDDLCEENCEMCPVRKACDARYNFE